MTTEKKTEDKYQEIGKLLSKKKFSLARRTAEKLAGSDTQFLCEVASLFNNLGQSLSAKHLFKRALEIDPKNPIAHYSYGLHLKSQKQLKDAETEFKTAIKYKPDYMQAHCMLGNTLLEQDKIKAAEKKFNDVLETDKNNLYALTGIAAVHLRRQEFDEAEQIYKKLIKLEKKYPVPYINLIMLYNQQGREKETKKMMKLAEKANLKITLKKDVPKE